MVVISSGLFLLEWSARLIVEVTFLIVIVNDGFAKTSQLDAHILVHYQNMVGRNGAVSEAHVTQKVHSHAHLTGHQLNFFLRQGSTSFELDVVDHVAKGSQLLEDVHAIILRDDVPSLFWKDEKVIWVLKINI